MLAQHTFAGFDLLLGWAPQFPEPAILTRRGSLNNKIGKNIYPTVYRRLSQPGDALFGGKGYDLSYWKPPAAGIAPFVVPPLAFRAGAAG